MPASDGPVALPTAPRDVVMPLTVPKTRNDVSGSVAAVVELAAQHGARVIAREDDAARLGDSVQAVRADEFADRAERSARKGARVG